MMSFNTDIELCAADIFLCVRISRNTRDDVVYAYARALCTPGAAEFDWRAVNRAITKRWSVSALKYIKREAWKIAAEWHVDDLKEAKEVGLGYKVISATRGPWFIERYLLCKLGYRYHKNETVVPREGDGPFAVFETKLDAVSWARGFTESRIVMCRYKKSHEKAFKVTLRSSGEQFTNCGLGPNCPPKGTVFASEVTCLE
jgi:hypothetical protein